ncbi:hypothetical protein [Dyadobacter luticola]|uniref:3-oxoacyl-ACP synthase n=1 Tax=Dyadobacter luticola TaxID=1979387 RepID=A0A5R9L549_9BACT|nr:hypothetical protein [Dyadobacter luticola]TLV03558.1 hypothetical protein FEN17_08125 [Dyadobacter luticola]
MSFITAYCHLRENVCSVNGELVATLDKSSEDAWFKQIYKAQEFVYPKFYKMDTLSQAGYLASELIKRAAPYIVNDYADDEIALIFANKSSSADTDLRFINSYEHNGAPSPSLFVYTLPNIVLGEIAILNKWYGENMFAVLPKFTPDFFLTHTQILFSTGSKTALCGWLEILGDKIHAFLFLIEQAGTGKPELNIENLSNIAGPEIIHN